MMVKCCWTYLCGDSVDIVFKMEAISNIDIQKQGMLLKMYHVDIFVQNLLLEIICRPVSL